MKERLERLRERIDALTLRERGMLFLGSIAVLYMLAQLLLFSPLEAQQRRALERIGTLQKEIAAFDEQMQNILRRQSQDPDADNQRQKRQLTAQIAVLDKQIGGAVQGLIAPQQMARVLEEVIRRQAGLRLQRIESLPARPLVEPVEGEAVVNAGIWRHGVRLEFTGDYKSALAYVRALQTLPWTLYWDELEIAMDKYPQARITIVVHTLSLNEGWIGV
ncbi:MAG: type II secretion system protein GspM [Thiohalomonadaceae bacterium]